MGVILVVDDNVDLCEVLEILLSGEGHHVDVRHDGLAALAYCAATTPDLVLLDVTLPGMHGLQVLRSLRFRRSLVPVLMLTAHAHADDEAAGRAAGANDYLRKPFEARTLFAAVARLAG